jgi:hypothetical protein
MSLPKVDAISIHHSVTPTPAANWSQAQEIAVLDAIHRYHVSQGFGGIGYHLCCFHNRWYYTASLSQWGASVAGQNNHVPGVCIIGTYTSILPVHNQIVTAAESVDMIDRVLKRKVPLRPHDAWGGTVCPARVKEKISVIRSSLPEPPPTGIWADVKAISRPPVLLYRDTNLVQLPQGTLVKRLVEGTRLDVAAQYRDSHYLTPYSYSRRIPNGFAISATVPTSCEAERRRIAELTSEVALIRGQREAWKARATAAEQENISLERIVQQIRDLVR